MFVDLAQILGHPEYGCFISQEKTLTNFDAGDGSLDLVDPSQKSESLIICPVPHSSLTTAFPWCGYTIGMRDLSIKADYTRYYGSG
jgi:telomerase reverse transcriptase